MIYEFAIDPAEVATWSSREKYGYVYNAFGIGTPRIVARLPKHWRRMVWDAFKGGTIDEQARIEELLKAMGEKMIRRPIEVGDWDSDWLSAILEEDKLTNFQAIISSSKDRVLDNLIGFEDMNNLNKLWDIDVRVNFDRSASEFARCFRPMLRLAEEIRFVDAHLKPHDLRHQAVSRALFKEIVANRSPDTVRVQFICQDSDQKPDWDTFSLRLNSWPDRVIPEGLAVEFIRLQENGRARFHDRFILTDIGGISLPDGLDEEDNPTPQGGRATVMRRDEYETEWQRYKNTTVDFNLEKTVNLFGRL